MNEIVAASGLHRIKGKFQKRFLAPQCESLTKCLVEALAATEEAAPVRASPYIIDRPRRREKLAHPEAQWEEALYWQWRDPGIRVAPWRRLLTYQVNLPNKKHAEDWGEIDLLGVSGQQLPVIVELKAPRSTESPAQMLIQAAAYGVALRKAWVKCFSSEWDRVVTCGERVLPGDLATCELVCAAPDEYWNNWTGETARAKTVKPNAWAAFDRLRTALAIWGYPSIFVRLGHNGVDEFDLPSGITVEEQKLPVERPA